jgi:tRNA(Ile)-lysidine synthase
LNVAGQRVIELGPEPPRLTGEARRAKAAANSFRIPLSIPGEVVLSAQRWAVSAVWAEETAAEPFSPHDLSAFVREPKGPLAVRSRRPGDRFQPPGLGGRARKLQDYLVDRKVARAERDLLPLVVDRDDRIVWIVGHGVAEGFRAAAPSPGVILLKAKYLGGEV